MRKLYEAVHAGRFFDLGGRKKCDALGLLAEVLGECCGDAALAGQLMFREAECETGIGHGLAIPHVRREGAGEILCVVGWSCCGLDFGAPDGEPVRLVAAYCVPDSAKNDYLREISGLVRAVFKTPSTGGLSGLANQFSTEAARAYVLAWLEPLLAGVTPAR